MKASIMFLKKAKQQEMLIATAEGLSLGNAGRFL